MRVNTESGWFAHTGDPARGDRRHRHRKSLVPTGPLMLAGVVVVALLLALAAFLLWRSPLSLLRDVIYVVWLVPLAELVMLIGGQLYYKFGFRTAPGKFRLLIIQVTTTGREQARVNEIIASLRSYALPMPHQIWVVAEPGHENRHPRADRVLTVPPEFTPRSERKGRALEYSHRIRVAEGLDQPWVKILYNDDDVLPTQGYVRTAFDADYDVCEGITAPRTEYATWPPGHVIASHADDIRTRTCLIYCSVFQGVLGNPLYVHGKA